ncbi:hypothetical protein LCGC14_1899400 [marine sediment metagenome]|uniref:Uncharacterized protein n=1 Tax=marine sediment metagenome TaxID=412755 RepID=A0A0F9FX28_9ZZZZ
MTAATVTERLEVNDPVTEVVILTATDADTYVSKKFGIVKGAQATIMEDAGALTIPLSLGISGATVTINCTGLSALKICLTLYGRK